MRQLLSDSPDAEAVQYLKAAETAETSPSPALCFRICRGSTTETTVFLMTACKATAVYQSLLHLCETYSAAFIFQISML